MFMARNFSNPNFIRPLRIEGKQDTRNSTYNNFSFNITIESKAETVRIVRQLLNKPRQTMLSFTRASHEKSNGVQVFT
jgi:hypothetical protein